MTVDKSFTIKELARELGGELIGDGEATVSSISDIAESKKGDIAFVMKKKFESTIKNTKASCVIVPTQINKAEVPIIKCKNPNLAFKKVVELLCKETPNIFTGVHKTASIAEGVKLGEKVTVGACSVIEKDASIGSGTTIYAQVYIGPSVEIGKDCVIYPNVTIRDNTKIGDRVILHPGVIIGADGFGYELTEKGHEKIPQIGGVIIESDVEIGAGTTVDRGKISNTKIGRGTKIDNLVQIAHNVTIGQNCVFAAQCGISGSVKIGNNVMMGGQVGIADHLEIGDNVILAAQAAIMKSVPSNSIMWGKPARPFKKAKEIYALFDKLPDIYNRLKILEQKLK